MSKMRSYWMKMLNWAMRSWEWNSAGVPPPLSSTALRSWTSGGALPLCCISSRKTGMEPSLTWWLFGVTRGCESCSLSPTIHPLLLRLVGRLRAPRFIPGSHSPSEHALYTFSGTPRLFSLIKPTWESGWNTCAGTIGILVSSFLIFSGRVVCANQICLRDHGRWHSCTNVPCKLGMSDKGRVYQAYGVLVLWVGCSPKNNKMASALPERAARVAAI